MCSNGAFFPSGRGVRGSHPASSCRSDGGLGNGFNLHIFCADYSFIRPMFFANLIFPELMKNWDFNCLNGNLQAVLKIIKHCKEFSPALVTGQLLGLDVGSVLEVTNCFPFPV